MADGDVGFLDALGIAGGNVQKDVHFAGERAAGFLRLGRRGKHREPRPVSIALTIFGLVPAGGESDDDVVWADERFHLAGENSFENRNRCPRRWSTEVLVVRASAGRPGRSVLRRTTSFRGQVLGVGGAASICRRRRACRPWRMAAAERIANSAMRATSASEKTLALTRRAFPATGGRISFDVARP